MNAAAVEVRTERFEWAHGHKPRGRGYWVFRFGGRVENVAGLVLYSAAVRAIKALAVESGHFQVEVLP